MKRARIAGFGLLSSSNNQVIAAGACNAAETDAIGAVGNTVQACIESSTAPLSADVITNCAISVGGLSTKCATCVGDIVYRVFMCNNTCDQDATSTACTTCKADVAPEYVVDEATGLVTMCNTTIDEDRQLEQTSIDTTNSTATPVPVVIATAIPLTTSKPADMTSSEVTISSITLMLLVVAAVI